MRIILLFLLLPAIESLGQTGTLMKVNGTELFVRDVGKGSPIIIVHGGPGLSHDYFLPQLMDLAQNHRLIFYDQRASGKSSAELDSTQMRLNEFVRDIDAIRIALKLDKVTVMAHSWGGLLAMKYAVAYPSSLRSLILLNTVAPKSGEFDKEIAANAKSRTTKTDSTRRANILSSPQFKAGDPQAMSDLFKLTFGLSFYDKSYLDSLTMVLPPDFMQKRSKLFMLRKDLSQYDLYDDIKRIAVPTLIVHGDFDSIPMEVAQKIQASIPKSKLVVIKGAGHFPFVEKRVEFNKQVNAFLGGVR